MNIRFKISLFFRPVSAIFYSVYPLPLQVYFSQMSLPNGKRLDFCESQWSATPIKTNQREDLEDPLLALHLDEEE